MSNGIYCYYDNLRCEIIYVGKDSYIYRNQRHKDHYQPSLKSAQRINGVLQNDNKSGRYSYAVLEQGDFTEDELNQKEISWIAFFKPRFCFTEGGDGAGSGENHPRYWKGKKFSKEHCKKLSCAHKGKKFSKEHCEKLSRAMSGENNPRFNPCISIRKQECKKCKQGFIWIARPYGPDEKQITLSNVDLQKCIEKVEEFFKSERNIYGYTSYEIIE